MKLTVPIFHLKRKARLLSRKSKIPLHLALDLAAAEEGFAAWSLLASKASTATSAERLFRLLSPGDLLLIGARPGQGKTSLGLKLAVEAVRTGHRAIFFTLEYTKQEFEGRFRAIGADSAQFGGLIEFDDSDAICSDYIVERLRQAPRGSVAIVDYLQLLDQKRSNPELSIQIRALKTLALNRGLIFAFISQIHRSYDSSTKAFPDLEDLRLPNPLDLTLFDKACFLNAGAVRFRALN
jgi:replicative DNA helicase